MGEIKSIEELANFCKRRGFVYRSGEIYGGLAGFWDFAPLGLALKQNIKREWWGFHVDEREEVLGIDGAIITNPKVWEASGHVQGFVELAVKCKKCGFKFKVEKSEANAAKCEKCGGEVEVLGEFNAMFKTKVGPLESDSVTAYLRPETAQSIFVNFKFLFENFRMRLPCGVAQIGKAFRNELSPREFLFRSREFEQMELEYFIHPSSECEWMGEIKGIKVRVLTANEQNSGKGKELGKEMELFSAWKEGVIKNSWHAYWIAKELEWFSSLGANLKNFRVRQHTAKERSHYSSDTWDIEYNFPMGWRELQGFANRGDFDLSQHEKFSGKSLEVNDPKHG
ncbi:glycine--tRNA ligase, partial [Candidatus Pacearchaeota archaeon]